MNLDHVGNIPKLVKLGYKGSFYVVQGSKSIIELMLLDALKVSNSNMEYISKKSGKKLREIYNLDHINKTLDRIIEIPYNERVKLTDNIAFEFLSNNHIFLASQIMCYIENSSYKRKVCFSGDLGGTQVNNYLIQKLDKVKKADYYIAECTYAGREVRVDNEVRQKDLEKLCTIIRETCVEKRGKVIIPTFSLMRSQVLLMYLYQLYHKMEIPFTIVYDSPLGVKVINTMLKVMKEQNHQDYKLLKEATEWDKVMLIDDFKSTQRILNDNHNSYVILTSSGFLSGGRVISYLEYFLPKNNATFLFSGYSGDEYSLSSQIKSGKEVINVGSKSVKNVAKAYDLKSFSSHMQYGDMIDYYSDINAKAIILQHGDMKDKYKFAEKLTQEISKKDKTTKVYVPIRGEVIELI